MNLTLKAEKLTVQYCRLILCFKKKILKDLKDASIHIVAATTKVWPIQPILVLMNPYIIKDITTYSIWSRLWWTAPHWVAAMSFLLYYIIWPISILLIMILIRRPYIIINIPVSFNHVAGYGGPHSTISRDCNVLL